MKLRRKITKEMFIKHKLFLAEDAIYFSPPKDSCGKRIVMERVKITQNVYSESLAKAKFTGCDFIRCYFHYVNFQDAVLKECTFTDCHFSKCNFASARLKDCVFSGSLFDSTTIWNKAMLDNCDIGLELPISCPSDGEFVGWKKVMAYTDAGEYVYAIAKLLIPEDANRLSANSLKCRTDKALCLDIQSLYDENIHFQKAHSLFYENFYYTVGEWVEPTQPFDEDRYNECSAGIHFFIDKNVAMYY